MASHVSWPPTGNLEGRCRRGGENAAEYAAGAGQWSYFGAPCLHQARHEGVSQARLQQVDQCGDVRDVAEVVDDLQTGLDLPVV